MVRSFATRLAFAALLGGGLAAFGTGGMLGAKPAEAGEWYRGGYGYQHRPHYGQRWGYSGTPGLDRHRWQQERWQRYGEATGRISPRESWRIDRAQSGLARHQAWTRADGVVTPWERRSLRDHARRVDGMIGRSMQDGYGTSRYYGRGW